MICSSIRCVFSTYLQDGLVATISFLSLVCRLLYYAQPSIQALINLFWNVLANDSLLRLNPEPDKRPTAFRCAFRHVAFGIVHHSPKDSRRNARIVVIYQWCWCCCCFLQKCHPPCILMCIICTYIHTAIWIVIFAKDTGYPYYGHLSETTSDTVTITPCLVAMAVSNPSVYERWLYNCLTNAFKKRTRWRH